MNAPHLAGWSVGVALLLCSLLLAAWPMGAAAPVTVAFAGLAVLGLTWNESRHAQPGILLMERFVTPTSTGGPLDRRIVAALAPPRPVLGRQPVAQATASWSPPAAPRSPPPNVAPPGPVSPVPSGRPRPSIADIEAQVDALPRVPHQAPIGRPPRPNRSEAQRTRRQSVTAKPVQVRRPRRRGLRATGSRATSGGTSRTR